MYDAMVKYLEADRKASSVEYNEYSGSPELKRAQFERDLAFYNVLMELADKVDDIYDKVTWLENHGKGLM